MENHFVTKYMIDGEWQEAIDDNTTNICLYCSFYNSNSELCSECCHANHAEGETKVKDDKQCIYDGQHEEECQCDECDCFLECFPEYGTE